MKNKLKCILVFLFLLNVFSTEVLFASANEFSVSDLSVDIQKINPLIVDGNDSGLKFTNNLQDKSTDKNTNVKIIPQNNNVSHETFNNEKEEQLSSRASSGLFYDVSAITNGNGSTKIIFSVTKDFPTNVQIINFPFRLIFDVPLPYRWSVPSNSLSNASLAKVISSISYGNSSSDTLRILANLKYPVNINNAVLVKNEKDNNYKFMLDVRQADVLTSLLSSNTIVVPRTQEYYSILQASSVNQKKVITEQKSEVAINSWVGGYLDNVIYPRPYEQKAKGVDNSSKTAVVVIDPGHGGKDPGAMPSITSNVREKDIVLNISKYVSSNLLNNPKISVVLIRNGDYFVPLKDRILWAKKFNADLFVSIHADRAPSPEYSGLSVYTLSNTASDAQTQVIAIDQNRSDLIAGLKDNEDSEVSRILINLLQRLKINDSVALAKSILNSVANDVKLLPNPIRFAGFAVLQVPEIPSVLVETGFLSNNHDTTNLVDPIYQQLIASKISKGIEDYLVLNKKINNNTLTSNTN